MNKIAIAVLTILCLAFCFSCGKKADTEQIRQSYTDLLEIMDPDRPGYSAELMKRFIAAYGEYEAADKVREHLKDLLGGLDQQFNRAKDLARDGDFEKAEAILGDLAEHFPGQDAGRRAAGELAFDLPLFKARALMTDRDLDGAEKILRKLLEGDLTGQRAETVHRMLDNIAQAKKSLDMVFLHKARAAGRHIQIMLVRYRAENGSFPETFFLEKFDETGRTGSADTVREVFDSVESYSTDKSSFRLVLVGKDAARTRFQVTDRGGVEVLK